ncbi:MAG: hypothetical protein KH452_00560 [Clostridiales bacterium]|nr:hypothetical protein [Clostridiales bacterium]
MIRIQNKVFWLCLTGTVVLATGLIFLPRYFSRSLDMRSLNQVQAAKREDFAFLESSPNGFLENARAFRHLRDEGSLTLVASLNESSKMNSELLERVYDQVMMAMEWGMLPWLGGRGYEFAIKNGLEPQALDYWADQACLAQYYNLTFQSESGLNTKEMLNFWYLKFSDNTDFEYSFIVNAVTYQIYYAEIYNSYTDYAVQQFEDNIVVIDGHAELSEKEGIVYEENQQIYEAESELFALGCMNYYEADFMKPIQTSNLHDKMALAVLNYGDSTVYMEKIPRDSHPDLLYRGISVGLQNLGDDIQKIIKE